MVAYDFKALFVDQLKRGLKLQTVRRHRRRHARPGETVQLYTGMRTRQCRKLVAPDPICTGAREIRISVGDGRAHPEAPSGTIEGIEIEGRELTSAELHRFAEADGFGLRWHRPRGQVFKPWVSPLILMGTFWLAVHGAGGFQGVLVTWHPRPEDTDSPPECWRGIGVSAPRAARDELA